MYTIENHLLHLNMGAGGSRDALQGVVGTLRPDYPLLIFIMCCNQKYDKVTMKTMQPMLRCTCSVPTTPCIDDDEDIYHIKQLRGEVRTAAALTAWFS